MAYRKDIDGLRAIAVLSVFAYHLNHSFLYGGYIGVDIFFVISGFLLTGIIYSELQEGKFKFLNFYNRRIKRILPMFFVACFGAFICSFLFLFFPEDSASILTVMLNAIIFWQNMFFANLTNAYSAPESYTLPLLHTWSLAVEEQFYFILPLLLLALYKLGVKWRGIVACFVVIIIGSFCISYVPAFLKFNYYWLLSRFGELLIGSLLAIVMANIPNRFSLFTNNVLGIFSFIVIILSLCFISGKFLFPSFWAAIPCIAVALLIYSNVASNYRAETNERERERERERRACAKFNKEPVINIFLSNRLFVFIGKISYSLYLWHWIIIVFYKRYFMLERFSGLDLFIIIVLTFILSILSYYFIEKPCRKLKISFKVSFLLFYLLPSLLIVGLYVLNKQFDFIKKTYENLYANFEANREAYKEMNIGGFGLSTNCYDDKVYINKNGDECVFGDISKKPKILMFGDSHAGVFHQLVEKAGQKYSFSFKSYSGGGCVFYSQKQLLLNKKQIGYDRCKAIEKIEKLIKEYEIILIANKHHYYDLDVITNDLIIFLESLNKQGKKVVVFKEVPHLKNQSMNKYKKDFLLSRSSTRNYDFFTHKEKETNEFLEQNLKGKAIFYDFMNGLSEKHKKEYPIFDNFLIYKDDNHLNLKGINLIADEVLDNQKDFWLDLIK